MPKFEGPYRVLEVRNNSLTIWKRERRVTVNIKQVRIYHPRQSDTNSFDCINETLYEGKGSSNWSNRSNSGKFRRSRKLSEVGSTGTGERYDRKRPKICRKRSLQESEYKATTKKALVLPQGLKRGVPLSIAFRTHKHIRQSRDKHPSQGPETLPGTSNQRQMRRFSLLKEESRRVSRVQSDRAGETRTTGSKGHSAAEGRLVWSGKTTTVRPYPYYLRSRIKEPEGLPEEQRNTGIDSLRQNRLRRRSLSMEALDEDPAERST
ncbi:uncharacterized protein TNCV_1415281 [Trichonephila clavipes]|nr:uncharacterized protein TNCV_1415281 [Trichonephila clavipes]